MKIFISYGHDRFEPVVQRIYDDLTALGYDVFKDNTETGIAISSRFDSSIDEAIEGCDFFISILSTHSVRENSVCLDEITRAREYDKGILPIRFEVVKVPLLICRYQWIDLFISEDEHGNPAYNEQDYLSVMRRIKNLLEGPALSRNVRSSEVENLFLPRPFDFSYTVASLTRNFSSRDWIDGAVHDWIVSDDFLLWMFGGAGSGKSSVISHIVSSKPGWITAVHLCQSNYTDSTRPTFVLFSLIYQLCVRLKEFRERLLGRTDAESLRTMAPNQLMHDALAVPLQKMEGEMVVLAVDGLDEMSSIDQSQFLQALAELMSCEPIRFKLILTARPEPGIMAASRNCGGRVITIDGDRSSGSANFGDCMRYAEGRLSEEGISSDDLRRIVERSDCNYLYLKYMLDDIQDNGFDAEADFPARIGGLYSSFFHEEIPTINRVV